MILKYDFNKAGIIIRSVGWKLVGRKQKDILGT